ncbi:MAG: polysaccharide biosynthesis tyrosine autokinase [Planctomycetota bacterium]|jgi:capsular exopolysaccharide synthesis family protein
MMGTRTIDPFRLLRRHMWLLAATGFVGAGLGVAAYVALDRFMPLYSGEVLFEIRSGLDEASDVGSRDIAQEDLVTRLASTEVVLLTSRDVLMAAVKEPDVQKTMWFKDRFLDPTSVPLLDDAVDELEDDVAGKIVRGTNLFGLRWSTGDPIDVPTVLNKIADKYLDRRYSMDDTVYNDNLDLYSKELAETNRKLDDLAREIEQFIREKGITSLDDPRSNQLALAMTDLIGRIADTNAELTMTQSAYVQTAAKLEGTIEPSDEDRRLAEEHPAARPHEYAVLQAKTALRELRAVYHDPDHWLLKRAENRLRALEEEYEAKIEEIMTANLQAMLKALADARQRFQDMGDELAREYEETGTNLRALAADMSRYLEMEDERDQLAAIRDANIELIRQLRLMRAREDARRVRLAQVAQTPREKSFPKIELIVPLATVLLLGLVTGLLFLRELTDQRVKTASDVALIPDARVLGVIPELAEDPCRSDSAELVVWKFPHSVLAESYRQTWALVEKALSRPGHQTLLLVGALPGSGNTTVTTNIAAAAAAAGRTVAIVDADFRRPRMGKAMGVPDGVAGLGDVLTEAATADEALQETELGISVMTAGRPDHRIIERLNNGQFDSVMADLRHRFDLVLVDSPPAIVAGDSLVLANKVEAAVLVVRAYQAERGLVARLMNQLVDAQCELLGVILNRPRGTAGGYFKKNFAAMAKYSAEPPKDQ